jgi:CDP-4-dehydro-6-deoxyglucose reductase, E3
MPSFSAELVARTALSPRVELLTFLAAEPFVRAGGQYLLLTLDEGSSHAFSIAAPFDEHAPQRFEIAVTRGTTAGPVLELELGGLVMVTGPSGALVWKADAPALLVASGTGISPLRAIVLEQLARSSQMPLTLLFGCRDAAEELWGAEFARLALEQPRFRYLPTHSQPLAGHPGRIGRVQAYLPELVRALGPELRAYLCGHTPMVNDCTTQLLEQGVPAEHIHGESY